MHVLHVIWTISALQVWSVSCSMECRRRLKLDGNQGSLKRRRKVCKLLLVMSANPLQLLSSPRPGLLGTPVFVVVSSLYCIF